MKLIKIQNNLTVVLSNGNVIIEPNCTDKLFNELVQYQDDEEKVLSILRPQTAKIEEEVKSFGSFDERLNKSKIFTVKGNSVYILDISEFSVPTHLVNKLLKAEEEDNQDLIKSYKNFWTLCCLNPDSRVRDNIFWFLDKYGMEITQSGLFVAYRNVLIYQQGKEVDHSLTKFVTDKYMHVRFKLKKSAKNYFVGKDAESGEYLFSTNIEKVGESLGTLRELYDKLVTEPCDTEESISTIYTDKHTETFRIQIGKIVTIPREDCDSDQDITCSNGLHVAGKTWLSQGYYGDVTLKVLVNPTDVVAVPHKDNYGKMRTCAYLPIQVVDYKDGKILSEDITGFEDLFFNQFDVKASDSEHPITGESLNYNIEIPDIPELKSTKILKNIDSIRQLIKNKEIK